MLILYPEWKSAITCFSYEQKVRNEYKIQNRSTGVTAISQHLVNTIDYICTSYMCDNTDDRVNVFGKSSHPTVYMQ